MFAILPTVTANGIVRVAAMLMSKLLVIADVTASITALLTSAACMVVAKWLLCIAGNATATMGLVRPMPGWGDTPFMLTPLCSATESANGAVILQ